MVLPREEAATESRPGFPARSGADVGPVLITSTETSGVSGAARPVAKPGSPVVWAVLPAFSYARGGRPSWCGRGISDSLAEIRVESAPTGSPVSGAPRYAAQSARTGAATTVATTVVVTARARSRSRRAARSRGSIGKPVRSKRGPDLRRRRPPPERSMAAWTAVRGAGTSGSAAWMPPVPGQGAAASTRSATRRQRGQSSTWRTSSARRVVDRSTWPSPVSRDTEGQLPVSTTARAARVRSTSQAAPASSSRAVAGGVPRTAASSGTPRRWRTASSRASRCAGVVPAASGQARRASSVRR